METTKRIQEIIHMLEDAISYSDMDIVDDAKNELVFLLEDLNSDYPTDFFEDEDL